MSSICFLSYGLNEAAWIARRIVVGTVLEIGSFRYPGSKQVPAQPEGAGFTFLRLRIQRTLKGPEVRAGEELRVFNGMEWYRYEHAEEMRLNVVSYIDPHYSEALPLQQIGIGTEILVFLHCDPVPPEFPSGAVFQAFQGAFDRADRADDVLAMLQEGPAGDYGLELRLQPGHRVRFPDGFEVVFLRRSPKRSEEEATERQWIEVGLAKDEYRVTLRLAHSSDADGKETGESRSWLEHTVTLIALRDGEPVIVARTAQ